MVDGKFGKHQFGGQYMPEILMPLIKKLEECYNKYSQDQEFWKEFHYHQKHYTGRPSPLYFAERTTKHFKTAKVYFKRDELNHTGSHKLNNCIGQVLLAIRMGKKHIIAETGAGQHGVATASVCAKFGIKCTVFMGEKDIQRQEVNVFKMKLLGASVISVNTGSRTLKDAMNEAMRFWASKPEECYYLIGTAAGPHPYPKIVKDFQSVIGKEAREQILEIEGKLPTHIMAVVGGGSNAIGLFSGFLRDETVKMYGIEAGGSGIDTKQTAATLTLGSHGIFHGNKTYVMQDKEGQVQETYSIAAGLDYPGIGPEHAHLNDTGRVQYHPVNDGEALKAMELTSKLEGIIPAIEPSHALAFLYNLLPKLQKIDIVIINLCGRGDKDIYTAMKYLRNV
ncbi:MAG: tryptophan synthase beta chain [Candidatus Deianiraeaceae bacterium]|jgi:tryptophan synthase beta chain